MLRVGDAVVGSLTVLVVGPDGARGAIASHLGGFYPTTEAAEITVAPDLLVLVGTEPGAEIVDRVREARRREELSLVPIIAVIGEHDATLAPAVLSAGADEIVVDPVDPEALLAAARRELDPTRGGRLAA